MSGNLPPGESLTFGSLTFITDGTGWFDTKPPFFPGSTIFFGSLRFVIDRYGDLRLRVPPPYLAVGVLPSEPISPIPPASGLKGRRPRIDKPRGRSSYSGLEFEKLHRPYNKKLARPCVVSELCYPSLTSENKIRR